MEHPKLQNFNCNMRQTRRRKIINKIKLNNKLHLVEEVEKWKKLHIPITKKERGKKDELVMEMEKNTHDPLNHLNSLNEGCSITIKHGDWEQQFITARGGMVVASLRPLK